jgi:hypothetical protein
LAQQSLHTPDSGAWGRRGLELARVAHEPSGAEDRAGGDPERGADPDSRGRHDLNRERPGEQSAVSWLSGMAWVTQSGAPECGG